MFRNKLKHWGASPALNLQEELKTIFISLSKKCPEDNTTNILILGAHDGRHILKTLANIDKDSTTFLNIYFVENSYVNICRQLFFLHLLCDGIKGKSCLETAEIFLEVYGNTLIRHNTYKTLSECSKLLKTQVDLDQKPILSFLCMDKLKQKDLMHMSKIFNSWQNPPSDLNIGQYWQNRLRKNLGTRYDCRKNIFDWDFLMELEDCSIINLNKYIKWRETGVAFTCRESRYVYPNRTLYTEDYHGAEDMFRGDTYSSPYLAYGIETEDQNLLRKVNGIHEKTSEDISLHNVISMIKSFDSFQSADEYVKVHPIFDESLGGMLFGDGNFENYFDMIVMDPDYEMDFGLIKNLLKPSGVLLLETLKYAIDKSKDYRKEHYSKVQEKILENEFVQLDIYNIHQHTHVAFVKSTCMAE